MSLLRIILLSNFIALFALSCKSSKIQTEGSQMVEELKTRVVFAEIDSWKGTIDGTSGEKITIKLVGGRVTNALPDSVWYQQTKGFKPSYQINKDTLIIYGSFSESKNVKLVDLETAQKTSGAIAVKSPVNHSGEGLIRFIYEGTQRYVVVDKFSRK
jgi:hypothetical protein